MEDMALQSIYNYRRLDDRIATGGMPTEAQLAAVARAGYQVVINLDQLDSRYALPDERSTVEALGMTYVQIPVIWTQPTHENVIEFVRAMEAHADKRLFVHCVANMRVSCFMAIYRVLRLGWQRADALHDVHAIWEPNEWWQPFVEREMLARDLFDAVAYNRMAWNRQVETGNEWTVPVGPEVIAEARNGRWKVLLTPTIPVPRAWFPELRGADVLCLASGGGQQGPIFAAAGANVTVFDNSPRQLAQDRLVAEREGLTIRTVEGQMAHLSVFADASFDLVFHPVSNVFAPDVRPVWHEAYRVLRPGGVLLAGFMNPAIYVFDLRQADRTGVLEVKHALPYADLYDLPDDQLQYQLDEGWPLEFSHSLDDQIGGQLDVGFLLAGLFEDRYPASQNDPISRYMPVFIATRALKPR